MYRKLHSQVAPLSTIVQVYSMSCLMSFSLGLFRVDDPFSTEGVIQAYKSQVHPELPGLGLVIVIWAGLALYWYLTVGWPQRNNPMTDERFLNVSDIRKFGIDFEKMGMRLPDNLKKKNIISRKLSFIATSIFMLVELYFALMLAMYAVKLFTSEFPIFSRANVWYALSEGMGPFAYVH